MATSWTDQGASSPAARVVFDVTKVREIHVSELRTAINTEIQRRGGPPKIWTNSPITAGVTRVRDVHINELREASDYAASIDCATDTTPIKVWSDNPIVHDMHKIRATHINELREYVNIMESACLSHCPHCSYSPCCNCDHCSSHCSPH